MKILAQATPGNTIAGFQRAAEALGHTWVWWEERHTPAFDVFDEVKPDLVMLMNETRPLLKCLMQSGVPVVKGYSKKPFEFSVNVDKNLNYERLVDKHMFNPGPPSPAYSCDFGIMCEPNPEGLRLCDSYNNVKIMSEEAWSVSQYLGIPSLEDKRDLYRSSNKVLVSNMIEAMRVISCGSVPISTHFLHKDIIGVKGIGYLEEPKTEDFSRENLNKSLQHLIVNRTYDDALKVILEELQ